tara:strand:+ start:4890 stop:5717 length:828 start_codon:yes stop_codon:yes gene_type:complete
MITVGQLDTPITLESPTTTANANYGGIQDTAYATALTAFGETLTPIWSHLIWRGGGESEQADERTGETKVDFYIRFETYKDIIKPNWRIKYIKNNSFSAEELINPNFDTSIAIGTNGSGWQSVDESTNPVVYHSGGVRFTKTTSGNCRLRAKDADGANILEQSTYYRVSYKVTAVNSVIDDEDPSANVDNFTIYGSGTTTNAPYTLGTHVLYFTSSTAGAIFQFNLGTVGANITIDNVSLKKVFTNTSYFYIETINHIDGRHKMTKLSAVQKDNE